MDIATFLGIASAFGLVFIAIAAGGGISLFFNLPSLMIVAGGTFGVTLINYPLKDVLGAADVVKNVFVSKLPDPIRLTAVFVDYSSRARREGVLSLESELKNIEDPFLRKALQLSVDGVEPSMIRDIMETELDALRERHESGAEIFTTMGTYSPALGMIGTLIGLVQMLQSMNNPDTIGPAMAVALLTTFYGSMMANLLFLPVAGKLRTRSREEGRTKELMLQGVLCIANGDNPRILEQRLQSHMPPASRHSVFRRQASRGGKTDNGA